MIIDAALGVVERGRWRVSDCVREQPWLPNGPIPLDATWRHPEPHPATPPTSGTDTGPEPAS